MIKSVFLPKCYTGKSLELGSTVTCLHHIRVTTGQATKPHSPSMFKDMTTLEGLSVTVSTVIPSAHLSVFPVPQPETRQHREGWTPQIPFCYSLCTSIYGVKWLKENEHDGRKKQCSTPTFKVVAS